MKTLPSSCLVISDRPAASCVQVRELVLKDACTNVRARVTFALIHAQLTTTNAGPPLHGYTFKPPNPCAAETSAAITDNYRNVTSTIYNDFTDNYREFHDGVQAVQKFIMVIQRLFEFSDIAVGYA
jgi:hypothetical protein